MRALILFISAVAVAFAADGTKTDDPWAKVKELKSGTEIRVYKKGSAQPLVAKAGDVTDEKVIMVVKNAEVAVDKKDIDRIDARPQTGKSRKVESRATTNDPASQPVDGVRPENYPKPGSSYSSAVSVGSKPDFETVYQRRSGRP